MQFPRLLFLILLSVVGFAQTTNVWTPRGPEGGVVGRAVVDPQSTGTLYVNGPQSPGTLYVDGRGPLFKTTDSAGRWSALSAGGPPYATVLAVDPRNSSTLYGANPNSALFKSTDGGLTWNPSDPLPCMGLAQFQPCLSLSFVIDPGNPSTLYVGHDTDYSLNGGMFKSTDGGATWNPAGNGLPVFPNKALPSVHALAIDPKNPGTLYAATVGGLFKSTDGAMSWSPVSSGRPGIPDALVIDPQNSNTLYANYGNAKNAVFKSTDGGSSWVDTGFQGVNLVVDPQDSAVLYAVSPDGIVKSMDGGGNWSVVLPGATTNSPGWWVAVTPGKGAGHRLGNHSVRGVVYGGTGWPGIFKSSDGGSTWAAVNSGLLANIFYTLAIDPQNPRTLYGGVYSRGLVKSTDGGASWSTTQFKSDFTTLMFDPRNQGTVYASTNPGVAKSIDRGQNWVQLPLGPVGSAGPIVIDKQNPDTIYFGGLKSSDAGASWVQSGLNSATLAIDPQIAGTIYVGSEAAGGNGVLKVGSVTSGVLKSVDGGRTWTGVNTLWQAVDVSGVMVDPTNSSVVYAQTTWLDCSWYDCSGYPDYIYSLKDLGCFKSTDGGVTWVKLDGVSLLGFDQQGMPYASTPAGVARSQDHGATWNVLPTAGLIAGVGVLAFDPQNPNHLFTGTAAGVFEITLAPLLRN
jgi:photosystem II stability/assembly factor-like uncharacterized protein